MNIRVHLLLERTGRTDGITVIIDVLQAFSTASSAFANARIAFFLWATRMWLGSTQDFEPCLDVGRFNFILRGCRHLNGKALELSGKGC